MFNKCNVQAVVLQALHLFETKQNATLASVAISVANSWTLHTISGTNSAVKKTTKSYGASVEAYCSFGAFPESSQVGDVIVPINRHMAVTFLNAEKSRLHRHRRRRRGQPLTTLVSVDITSPAATDHATAHGQVSGRLPGALGQRGAGDPDGSASESDASVVCSSSGSDGNDSGAPPSELPAAARRASARPQSAQSVVQLAARTGGSEAAGRAPTGARPSPVTTPPAVSAAASGLPESPLASSAVAPPAPSTQTRALPAVRAPVVASPHIRKVGQSVCGCIRVRCRRSAAFSTSFGLGASVPSARSTTWRPMSQLAATRRPTSSCNSRSGSDSSRTTPRVYARRWGCGT
eukprot:TRINITY_DN7097_c0_g1_i1.p2 TRINITY_DN7097_c0_g1~~TRINITY_DN7097_c0_g1_i1.p2  ORF type:complete len:349 (-),score=24.91 TRINITY_DN7097_c0_g1_i1:971-2017(-)